jgi:hypothetical protein
MWTLFLTAAAADFTFGDRDRAELKGELCRISGLRHARIMVPVASPADQPFAADGRGPDLALQLYFEDRAAAEAAVGHYSSLPNLNALARLPYGAVSHQLMRGRSFPTPPAAAADPCLTFLVTYPGPSENQALWLDHYDLHHPPIMVRFPRIREVETYRPIDWSSSLPFARDTAMQRNKVVFDSLADLIAALASPVMLEMQADTKGFPPFAGKTTHFPMTTWRVDGRVG